MQLQVLLFGAERTAAGRDRVAVDMPPGATCLDIRDRLAQICPSLSPHLHSARFAVNGQFVPITHGVSATDEVALIGLVSGG